jgi:hypothetical protein
MQPKAITSVQQPTFVNRTHAKRDRMALLRAAGAVVNWGVKHPIRTILAFSAISIAMDRAVLPAFAGEPERTVVASGPVPVQNKISLEKLRILDRQSLRRGRLSRNDQVAFMTDIDVDFAGKPFLVWANICKQPGCVPGGFDAGLVLGDNGKVKDAYDLKDLAKAYFEKTGKQLTYVSLTLEVNHSSFTIYVMAADYPNQSPQADMPVVSVSSDGSKFFLPGSSGVLASVR